MKGPRRSGPAPTPRPDGRTTWRPARRSLVLAAAMLVAVLAYVLMTAPDDARVAGLEPAAEPPDAAATAPSASKPPTPAAPAAPAAAPPPPSAASTAARSPRLRDLDGDQTLDIANYVNPGETPTLGEV